MDRFIGVKNGKIQVVSDKRFSNPDLHMLALPKELAAIPSKELIRDYVVKNDTLYHHLQSIPAKKLRLAFVANYGMNCGIATYSQFLYRELSPLLGESKIFAEQYRDGLIDNQQIVHCWKRGESLTQLIQEIRAYNPDVILIQHEWGLWHNSRQWISMMGQLSNFRVIATMHSVFYHKDKSIVEASIPEIIVHLESAQEVLSQVKKISARIYTVPHGCFPPEHKERLWNFYKTEHNFIQFGFLFKYKGMENSIKATALLKSKYPDVYFTGICSESSNSQLEHDNYFDELLDLVNQLGVSENVGLIRGFQSEEILDTFLKMNRVALFPYINSKEHECFGSSGAVPYAMSKGIPVITSNIHHFENLPTIKAETAEDMARELDRLFSQRGLQEEQIEKQNQYLNENSWQKVAQMYAAIMEKRNS